MTTRNCSNNFVRHTKTNGKKAITKASKILQIEATSTVTKPLQHLLDSTKLVTIIPSSPQPPPIMVTIRGGEKKSLIITRTSSPSTTNPHT